MLNAVWQRLAGGAGDAERCDGDVWCVGSDVLRMMYNASVVMYGI